jgi:hypothetical protein
MNELNDFLYRTPDTSFTVLPGHNGSSSQVMGKVTSEETGGIFTSSAS